jgi:hypothetical protein
VIRVIISRVGERPSLVWLPAGDPGDPYLPALRACLGGVAACLPLGDGVDVWCSRDGWLFGLALTRMVIGAARTAGRPPEGTDPAVPLRSEHRPLGDFVLARSTPDNRLADLTEADIRLWMFWLEFDRLMGR